MNIVLENYEVRKYRKLGHVYFFMVDFE